MKAAPSRPHPEVMSEIGKLCLSLCLASPMYLFAGKLARGGEATMHMHMDKLEAAFAYGLEQAREKIGNSIARTMSRF